ncbi:Hsp20/alpha crystallin family protein [Salinactinospora qingdaonensis]
MSEMNRIADYMSTIETGSQAQPRGHADAWSPTTDIFARGNDLVIQAELPGVQPEDVEVSFSGGYLDIDGERRRGEDADDVIYYTSERFRGRFRREFVLPSGIDDDDISARFDEGLLEVTVRGGAGASGPSVIQVQSNSKKR